MSVKITIGIPCYNSAQWLKAAIDSALAQTIGDCEVIVADDGSTDSSLVIASAFGDHITLLRNAHRGANYARNQILERATGDWIQYLDADDCLQPGKIATQLAEVSPEDADVIYSPTLVEEHRADGSTRREPSELHMEWDLYAQWLAWELPQTGGALWRRSTLQEIGSWRADQPCCQEHELYSRALKAGLRFRHAPTPGAIYRIWSNTTLCRKDPRLVIQEKTKLIDAMRDWMEQKKIWTELHRQIAGRACMEMARTLAKENVEEAAKYFAGRRKRGLIEFAGPAAPRSYRWAVKTIGFRSAESLGRVLRKG